MARGPSGIERPLRMLFEAGAVGGLGDARLLDRFLEGDGPEAGHAFATLVERHGPMVLATCRALLGDRHEAEDAFQATFLVLARRAGSIGRRESVAAWLHGVACRVARKARLGAARRRARERRAAIAAPDASWDRSPDDLAPALHEELGRLPEAYRAPIVLCYLEGLTHDQAAARLGWPVGTVRGRMARARALLRTRLARRGLAPAAGAFSTALVARRAVASVPDSLIDSLVRAAAGSTAGSATIAGMVPARVATLSQGVLTAMRWNAIGKTLLVAIPAAALAVGGVAARPGDGPPQIPTADPPRVAEAPPVVPPIPDPGPAPDEATPTPILGEFQVLPDAGSFSAYEIPEGFDIDGFLESSQAIELEINHLLAETVDGFAQDLAAMQEQQKQVAEAMVRTRNAFATIRARRDALKATIADEPPPPASGEVEAEAIRAIQEVEQETLTGLEEMVQEIGGTIRALEAHDRAFELSIRRLSAVLAALSGAEESPSPTIGDLPLPSGPPALDAMARRTSADPAPADPRDRRIDALERKLDAILEALHAPDR